MPEVDAILRIRDLTVKYRTESGEVTAVDHVDLDVHRGEILGVAGRSGCGKSTMATTVLGLLRPPGYVAGGSALWRGDDGGTLDVIKTRESGLRSFRWRHLALLPQASMNSLNPVSRVRDQFEDVMLQHGWRPSSAGGRLTRRARRSSLGRTIEGLLEQVGLDGSVAHMYPHELSGGMKQRVVIAMAVALEPDLLIADEPTTALDVTIQRVVIQNLMDLRNQIGMTMMVITHDMGVHAQLADRVAVMNEGKIVEVGPVRDIFKNPADAYTKALIESIPDLTVREEAD